jgi:hypothetical protein
MKNKIAFSFILIASFLACEKESINSNQGSYVNNVVTEDTAKVPINDLGSGTYLGFTGGLYPNGSNTPSGQYQEDLQKFCSDIQPRDNNGRKTSTGFIGFISLGGSTSGHLMSALINKTESNPATNPQLKMVSCSDGKESASINQMMNPDDPYWSLVASRLDRHNLSPKQVEIIYLETEDSTKALQGFPARPYTFRDRMEAALRVFKTKFPKLKLVYVLGRTTTFSVSNPTNQEPDPYYNGWTCKFVIEDQINGVQGTDYKGLNAVAPMITWGWYEWANGTTTPRKDGFVWLQNETTDGLHGTDAGEDTLSTRFQNFLLTDNNAKIWYTKH